MFTDECKETTINQCLAKRVVCICDVILKHQLFTNLVREETHKLSNIADIIDLEDKEVLFFKMQQVDRIYFVLRGRVKLYNIDDNSSKEYIYQILEQGDAAGLENLFTELQRYPYTATAISPSKILTLKATEFKSIVEDNPIIKTNFLEYLSRLSLDLYDRSKDYVLAGVSERLYKYLNYQSRLKNSKEFELNISKTDLANYLGTISSTLSRAFKELENNSKISIIKTKIKIN